MLSLAYFGGQMRSAATAIGWESKRIRARKQLRRGKPFPGLRALFRIPPYSVFRPILYSALFCIPLFAGDLPTVREFLEVVDPLRLVVRLGHSAQHHCCARWIGEAFFDAKLN